MQSRYNYNEEFYTSSSDCEESDSAEIKQNTGITYNNNNNNQPIKSQHTVSAVLTMKSEVQAEAQLDDAGRSTGMKFSNPLSGKKLTNKEKVKYFPRMYPEAVIQDANNHGIIITPVMFKAVPYKKENTLTKISKIFKKN